jgi:hypothetical protein
MVYTVPSHTSLTQYCSQWTYPIETPNIPCFNSHIHFPLPRSFHIICPILRPCVTYHNKLAFYNEVLLAPCQAPKLECHPLLVFHACLFHTFIATIHICRLHPPSTSHAIQWRQGPTWYGLEGILSLQSIQVNSLGVWMFPFCALWTLTFLLSYNSP